MGFDILCMGNSSYDIYFPMDGFPLEDQKYKIETFLEACGGPAANAAYLLGMWNASCSFAGCLGDDEYGRKITEEFQAAGVDISLIEIRDGFHTPLSCIITNSRTGSRTIMNRRIIGNNMNIDIGALRKMNPRFLLFDSHEFAASLKALEFFPGAVSMLDAGSLRPASEDLARRVTHLLCSESFARAATKTDSLETDPSRKECGIKLKNFNPNPGCVTLGDRGLVFWEGNKVFYLPPFKVKSLDSTAAGDIFHGAFAYALYAGESFRQALLTGSAAAALSAREHGGRPSIPGIGEVKAFIKTNVQAGTLPQPREI